MRLMIVIGASFRYCLFLIVLVRVTLVFIPAHTFHLHAALVSFNSDVNQNVLDILVRDASNEIGHVFSVERF